MTQRPEPRGHPHDPLHDHRSRPHVRGEHPAGPTGDPSASFSVTPEERVHHADPLVRPTRGSSPVPGGNRVLWVVVLALVVLLVAVLVGLLL